MSGARDVSDMSDMNTSPPARLRRRQWLRTAAGLLGSASVAPWLWAQPAGNSTIAARIGTVPAPERLRRVFAAGPPAGVLLATLAPQLLLGWPLQLGDAARAYLGPTLAQLPHLGRLSGRGSTMPLETLLTLNPDLIVDAGTTDATHVSAAERLARQTGLPVLLVQGSLAEHARQLREVGTLLGVAERAQALAAYADGVAQLAAQLRASVAPDQRPRVYYGRSANGLETGLDGSINVEVVDYASGRNVAAQAGRGGLTRVSMEQILAWDPEVIVTQEAGFAQRLRQDPLWRSVSAVRHGRVHCAPVLPFGWLDGPPSVNRLIGVRWLLEKLHPGHPALQKLPPLAQEVARFYQLFYGATLNAQAVERLLNTMKSEAA